jgi:hypothetical protein
MVIPTGSIRVKYLGGLAYHLCFICGYNFSQPKINFLATSSDLALIDLWSEPP